MEQKLNGKWVKKKTSNSSKVLDDTVEPQADGEETRAQSTPQKRPEIATLDKKNYEWNWDPLQKAWTAGSPKKFQESPAASTTDAQSMVKNAEGFCTRDSPKSATEKAPSEVYSIFSKKKDTETPVAWKEVPAVAPKDKSVVSQYETELQRVLKRMEPMAKARSQPKEEPEKEPTATERKRAENKVPIEASFEEQLQLFLDRKAKGVHQQTTSVAPFVSNAPTLSSNDSDNEPEEVIDEIDQFDAVFTNDAYRSEQFETRLHEEARHRVDKKECANYANYTSSTMNAVLDEEPRMAEETELWMAEEQELYDNVEYSHPSEKTGGEFITKKREPSSCEQLGVQDKILLEPDDESQYVYKSQRSVNVSSRPLSSRSDPPAPKGSFDGFQPPQTRGVSSPGGPPGPNGSFDSLGAARKRSPISPSGGSLERLRASRRRGGLSPGGPPGPNGSVGVLRTRGPLSPGGVRVVDLREAIDQFTNDLEDVVMLEAPPLGDDGQQDENKNGSWSTTPKQRRGKDLHKSVIYIEDTMMLESPPSSTPKKIDVVVHRKTKTPQIQEPLVEAPPLQSVDGCRKKNDVVMLEIPKSFDVNNKEAIQRLIEAATSECESLEVSTRLRDATGRKLASPGISAANTPVGFTSPTSNISGGSRYGSKALSFNQNASRISSLDDHRSAQQPSDSERHTERRAPSPGISAAHGAMPYSPSNYSTRSNTTGFNSSGRTSHYSQAKTSTRSEHPTKRAPSPGISTASIPVSRGSDLYATSTASTPTGGRPRITPETQTRSRTRKPTLTSHHSRHSSKRSGYSQSHHSSATHPRVDHSLKSQKSKNESVDLASKSRESPIIDIESIRKSNWREGRDEVIIVDSPPHLTDSRDGSSVNTTSLDALLARIEQAKSQLEDDPDSGPADGNQYKLSGLIDNLSKAADEMDRIEMASSHYRF